MAKRNRTPAVAADITGRSYHQLDGRWGRSRTIFDSELYKALLEVINHALGHVGVPFEATDPADLESLCKGAGLTEAQWEAVAMRVEGFSTREVAAFLDISQPAVMDRLKRARETLVKDREKKAALSLLRGTVSGNSQEAFGGHP